MELIYRGVNYQPQVIQPQQLTVTNKYRLSNAPDSNKIILIKPIHYYTYRGVSYAKNLVFDTKTKLLLDIDRQ